jgi:hypothetical protein
MRSLGISRALFGVGAGVGVGGGRHEVRPTNAATVARIAIALLMSRGFYALTGVIAKDRGTRLDEVLAKRRRGETSSEMVRMTRLVDGHELCPNGGETLILPGGESLAHPFKRDAILTGYQHPT